MAVTLRDVAARAGVSRAAVSRTFTPGASVSPAMRSKVERAAQELGYSPNMLARGLITRQTGLIGLVSNNFANPVFLQIFDLVTKALQDKGLRPLLVNLSDETDPARSVQLLRSYSVDGVIVASSHLPDGFAAAFRAAGLPVVHAFGPADPDPEVHVVGIDNVAAGAMAAKTLIARGYRRLGFLGGPASATTTKDRLRGFLAAAEGRAVVQTCNATAYSFAAGRAEMARLVTGELAEAYFCGDDVLSIGALSALKDAGIAVPDRIGLIGVNDMEMAGWANIGLTTIHQPFAAIMGAAVDVIVALLDDPARPPQSQLFPCHVVERATLRPVRPYP